MFNLLNGLLRGRVGRQVGGDEFVMSQSCKLVDSFSVSFAHFRVVLVDFSKIGKIDSFPVNLFFRGKFFVVLDFPTLKGLCLVSVMRAKDEK